MCHSKFDVSFHHFPAVVVIFLWNLNIFMQQSGIYRRHFNTYLFNFNDVLLTDGELFNSTLYTIDNTCHYIVHLKFLILPNFH